MKHGSIPALLLSEIKEEVLQSWFRGGPRFVRELASDLDQLVIFPFGRLEESEAFKIVFLFETSFDPANSFFIKA
jgi:hypothetical protein